MTTPKQERENAEEPRWWEEQDWRERIFYVAHIPCPACNNDMTKVLGVLICIACHRWIDLEHLAEWVNLEDADDLEDLDDC